MKTKIKSITVVNLEGTRAYRVGNIYNGLLLDRIEDRSMEVHCSIYVGVMADGFLVFEVVNAPIDVEYEAAE